MSAKMEFSELYTRETPNFGFLGDTESDWKLMFDFAFGALAFGHMQNWRKKHLTGLWLIDSITRIWW